MTEAALPGPLADVEAADRLSFTLFLALALHALVILGVTFAHLDPSPSTHRMEVTLAQYRSAAPPDKADYLAQFNQQGSGTLEEKALLSTTERSPINDPLPHEPMPQPAQSRQTSDHPEVRRVTTTSAAPAQAPAQAPSKVARQLDSSQPRTPSLLERSLEIASLEARLEQQRQIYAKRPRIKRLTSLATKATTDAYYLNSWRRKIETIGNLNYPAEARRDRLYGELRLLVALRPDGSVKDIHLLQSSGHKVLDDAAVRIVRLAEPFAPFPDELRATTDVLEIIRTWQFRKQSASLDL